MSTTSCNPICNIPPPLPPITPTATFSGELRRFLDAGRSEFNTDLIDTFLEEAPRIEVQVNIRTDLGEPRQREYVKDGKKKTFDYRVHEGVEFNNIRYPHGSMDCPDWDIDPSLQLSTFRLRPRDRYDVVCGIGQPAGGVRRGCRFWPQEQRPDGSRASQDSRGLQAHRVHRDTAVHVGARACICILLLRGIQVKNHGEHAAIARCLLAKVCEDAGLEFSAQVDCMGGNVWFWSRRATAENRGFECLKRAARTITPDDLPANWQEHVEVIARRRARVRVLGWPESEEGDFAELASAFTARPEGRRAQSHLRRLREDGLLAHSEPRLRLLVHAHRRTEAGP